MALSNSGTIVPGEKLPSEPPWFEEGHEENSRAQSWKLFSPLAIIFMRILASPSDSTRMCRAVALTLSGGGPYSSLEKALDIESKIPMPRDDDDDEDVVVVVVVVDVAVDVAVDVVVVVAVVVVRVAADPPETGTKATAAFGSTKNRHDARRTHTREDTRWEDVMAIIYFLLRNSGRVDFLRYTTIPVELVAELILHGSFRDTMFGTYR